MNIAGFIAVELLFLAAAHAYGGPAWVVIGVLAFCGQAAAGVRLAPLAILVPALGWLALSRGTGNRELFFPYCIYLASHVAVALTPRVARAEAPRVAGAQAPRVAGAEAPRSFGASLSRSFRAALGGGLVVAAFLAVRVLQRAGPRVLAVESIVAVAILAVVLAAAARLRRGGGTNGVADWVGDAVIVVGASLAAYAGLAL
jgi:hypothetical protein